MTTICPNCSRPVRQGAVYCSYCGTDLTVSVKAAPEAAPDLPVQQPQLIASAITDSTKKPKRTGIRLGRILFILLVLILLIATLIPLLSRIWTSLSP